MGDGVQEGGRGASILHTPEVPSKMHSTHPKSKDFLQKITTGVCRIDAPLTCMTYANTGIVNGSVIGSVSAVVDDTVNAIV